VEYFKKALGGVKDRGMSGVRMDDEEEEITRKEVRRAVRKVKEEKAAGGDEILGEMWKYGGERLEGYVWEICKRIWEGEEWIDEWNEGIIVPIRKQGEGEKVEEYRGVTLMPTLYKIYAMILGERLEREVEEGDRILHNQTGFRKGWGRLIIFMF